MNKSGLIAAMCSVTFLTASALARVVPPPPKKTPAPAPKAETPAAPATAKQPAPPAPDAEPDLPPINLVQRNAEGVLIAYDRPIDEVALKMIMKDMDKDQQAKINSYLEEREARLEQKLANNAGVAMKIWDKREFLKSGKDATEMRELGDTMKAISGGPVILPALQSEKLLTAKQFQRANKGTGEYRTAMAKDLEARVGKNMADMIVEAIRIPVRENSIEPMGALSTMLARVAKDWKGVKPMLSITPAEQTKIADFEKAAAAATDDSARAEAAGKILSALDEEQQKKALSAVLGK